MEHARKTFRHIEYVFLDRDGVINRKPPEGKYVCTWHDFHLLPGTEGAIAALNASGRKVIVVTNQRGVALGLYTEDDVRLIHTELQRHLAAYSAHVDAFYFCPHDNAQCSCRKPEIGLFEQAFRDFPDASRANSILIGDSISDIQAARRLAIPSIFIPGEPGSRKPGGVEAEAMAEAIAESLAQAVDRYFPL
ncbi:MAG TPA: HAD family hydrolase [Acidobacteriaceae bacterium]|nr:HAD family hydrolase [Acidobacteriaceae bacterium]